MGSDCGGTYADNEALSTHTEGMTSYVMKPDGSGKPLTAGEVKQRFANITRGSDRWAPV
ncbi:MAG: oxidoreductase [Pseudomonas sp.]|nr:oxidoreductase [Pseudomonas sp.]